MTKAPGPDQDANTASPLVVRPRCVAEYEWGWTWPGLRKWLWIGRLLIGALVLMVTLGAGGGPILAVILALGAATLFAVATSNPGQASHREWLILDAPRRTRPHAGELGDHIAEMYAVRAVARGAGVVVELLRYDPVPDRYTSFRTRIQEVPARAIAAAYSDDGVAVSLSPNRAWIVTVVDDVALAPGTTEEVALRTVIDPMDQRARRLETQAMAEYDARMKDAHDVLDRRRVVLELADEREEMRQMESAGIDTLAAEDEAEATIEARNLAVALNTYDSV